VTRRRAALAALVVTVVMLLQRCLMTRVLETQAQLCDQRPAQVVVVAQAGQGLRVVFHKLTLTEKDVVAIVGFAPSATRGTGARRESIRA